MIRATEKRRERETMLANSKPIAPTPATIVVGSGTALMKVYSTSMSSTITELTWYAHKFQAQRGKRGRKLTQRTMGKIFQVELLAVAEGPGSGARAI